MNLIEKVVVVVECVCCLPLIMYDCIYKTYLNQIDEF